MGVITAKPLGPRGRLTSLKQLFGGFVDPDMDLKGPERKLPWEKAYEWIGIFQFFCHHIILALLVL